MPVRTQTSIYNDVIKITDMYLGPAAQRFVDRQVSSHLGKDPTKLHRQDMTSLLDWMSTAMAVLLEDKNLVDSYTLALQKLSAKATK